VDGSEPIVEGELEIGREGGRVLELWRKRRKLEREGEREREGVNVI